MKRKRNPVVETEVLTKSGRRCCICFGLSRDFEVKKGQIAHLDHDPTNTTTSNLAFLCLEHHDFYDTKTSQSKGLTLQEVKSYREELYEAFQAFKDENLPQVQNGLREFFIAQQHLHAEIIEKLELIISSMNGWPEHQRNIEQKSLDILDTIKEQ